MSLLVSSHFLIHHTDSIFSRRVVFERREQRQCIPISVIGTTVFGQENVMFTVNITLPNMRNGVVIGNISSSVIAFTEGMYTVNVLIL